MGGGGFLRNGCDGLLDEPRPGASRRVTDEDVERIVVRTLETNAAGGDALEPGVDGPGLRPECFDGRSRLARVRAQAPS